MPRYTRINGPTAELVEQRLDPTVVATDGLRKMIVTITTAIEQARSGLLGRERDQVIAKYGADSPRAARATARVTRQAHAVGTLEAELARVSIGAVRLEPSATVVHGRVDAADAVVNLVDASGRTIATAKPDATGYFRLSAPVAAPATGGPPTTAAPPAPQLVIVAQGKEVHREPITEAAANQVRYREITTKRTPTR